MFYFLLVSLYLLPALVTYLGIRRYYKTKWEMLSPDLTEVFIVFVPVVNLLWAIFLSLEYVFEEIDALPLWEKQIKPDVVRKFFRL